jgi:F0F1-type ATP synthase membrane subunit c/vacuolar-type H+-ATPase subunit K
VAVTLEFLADISGATKEIAGLSKSVDKQISAISSAFNGLTTTLAGLAAAIGVGLSFKSAIDQAAQYEDAVNNLATAFKLTGIESQSAVDGIVAFASEIQNTTRLSDDAVLSAASLLQSIARLSEDGLKKGTQAAIDLSAALRIDLESATRLVGKAAEGNVEAFKRYGIEIRKGSNDAETFSNTLDTLNSRFGGSAVAATNTYAGAIDQLKNVFDDVLKTYGLSIIQNDEFIQSIKDLTKSLIELVPLMVTFGNATAKAFNFLARSIKGSGLNEELQAIHDGLKDANPAAQDLLVKRTPTKAVSSSGLFSGAPRPDLEGIKKAEDSLKKIREDAEKARERYELKLVKEKSDKEAQERQRQFNITSSLITNISQGAQGAAAAFQNVSGFIADSIIPGLGGVVSGLVGFLAQGPEAVKAQIQAFIDALPEVIQAIIDSIPAVIEALANAAPIVAISLANQMPLVGIKLATSLIAESPNIAKAFIQSLISESGRLIQSIADGVKEAIKSAAGFAGGGGVKGALSGSLIGGIVGGPIGSVGGALKKLKFAEGGVVPGGAPFTDRVPAMLTPGEVVLSRDQVREVQQERASASGGSDRPMTINLMVGEQELANVILNLNRQGFRLS